MWFSNISPLTLIDHWWDELYVCETVVCVLTLEPCDGKSRGGTRTPGVNQEQDDTDYQQVLRAGPLQARLHL